MKNDWRLVNQENFLMRKNVVKAHFFETADCDHTHCVFCWEKIGKQRNMLNTAYRIVGGNWWICEKCFTDFKEHFGFQIISTD